MLPTFFAMNTRLKRRALQRNRSVAFVAALALLSATSTVSARTIFPAYGGPGDRAFDDHCPAHQFLIGLAGHGGLWIDRVAIICAPVLPDGTHGTKYYGPSHGGGGGSTIEFSCAADSVVDGAVFYLYPSMDHEKMQQVTLSCVSLQGNRQSGVPFAPYALNPAAVNYNKTQQCPSGETGSGFNGHYGKDVNAMGLDCAVRTVQPVDGAPAAVLTPVPPIKITGKATSTSAQSALACPQGFVWRAASPTDNVCVTPVARRIAAQQNATGASHVSQTDSTYGSNTCAPGYVWREAFVGDVVCVTPPERDAAKNENANAPAQVPKN